MRTGFSYLRWCIFALLLTLSSVMAAQTRIGSINAKSTTEEIQKYFRDNIMLLDPIEGAWNVESVQKTWNNYITFPDKSDNHYMVIVKFGKEFRNVGRETILIMNRIGETNVYNCKTLYNPPNGPTWISQRVVLENGILFNVTSNFPTQNVVGLTGRITETYIKEYPTASMYAEAISQQQKATEWTGTGFALMDGYVVTNHHVVKDASSISVVGVKGENTEMKAKVVAVDSKNDLALIRINDSRFNGFGTVPYSVKNTVADTGADVFVLGYPMTQYMGEEIKLTNGIISSRSGYQGDITTYQISAPVQPGNSGGPMFDKNGNVIGVVNAGIPDAENVGYAIKTSYLYNLVSSEVSNNILPTNNSLVGKSLADKVKAIRNFVFQIKCH